MLTWGKVNAHGKNSDSWQHVYIFPDFSLYRSFCLQITIFNMSYTYIVLIVAYFVVTFFPKEDLESLDWIIAFLMLIVVFVVSVDEIWG